MQYVASGTVWACAVSRYSNLPSQSPANSSNPQGKATQGPEGQECCILTLLGKSMVVGGQQLDRYAQWGTQCMHSAPQDRCNNRGYTAMGKDSPRLGSTWREGK